MLVRSDRRWEVAADRATIWSAMDHVDQFQAWWPWLRRFEAEALKTGDVWRCAVQAPVPWALRFTVKLVEVLEPRLVRATVDGDIAGDARLELTELHSGCELRLTSALAPANRVLRAATVVARPLVRYGHDWVIDTGVRQFASRAR